MEAPESCPLPFFLRQEGATWYVHRLGKHFEIAKIIIIESKIQLSKFAKYIYKVHHGRDTRIM